MRTKRTTVKAFAVKTEYGFDFGTMSTSRYMTSMAAKKRAEQVVEVEIRELPRRTPGRRSR